MQIQYGRPYKEVIMENELTLSDLNEMLGILFVYQGNSKIQMNYSHAVEILERLIAFESIKAGTTA